MASRLNPYVNFRDNARSALEYYQSVLGGKLELSTFGEGGMADDPSYADKIMHGQLDTPSGFTLMCADSPPHMPLDTGSNIQISISGDDEPELRGYWDGLIQGGQTVVPLEKAPWGDTFGMLVDKFGVQWMINITTR